MDVLRPFFLVACVAFAVGFVGYWALGRLAAPGAEALDDDWKASISAPVSEDWNPAKKI